MKVREDRSVKNVGIITGNVNTGESYSESSNDSEDSGKNRRMMVICAVTSGLLIAAGTIIAALLRS